MDASPTDLSEALVIIGSLRRKIDEREALLREVLEEADGEADIAYGISHELVVRIRSALEQAT